MNYWISADDKNNLLKNKNRKLKESINNTPLENLVEDQQELNHLKKYEYIKNRFDIILDKFKKCLEDELLDSIEELIEKCLGDDKKKVSYDIEYEEMKILSKADIKIRKLFIDLCYKPAGLNTTQSEGCDSFETDVLDLYWNKYDAPNLLEINKLNYISDIISLDPHTFEKILTGLKEIYGKLSALLDLIGSLTEMIFIKLDDTIKVVKLKPHYKNLAKRDNNQVVVTISKMPNESKEQTTDSEALPTKNNQETIREQLKKEILNESENNSQKDAKSEEPVHKLSQDKATEKSNNLIKIIIIVLILNIN